MKRCAIALLLLAAPLLAQGPAQEPAKNQTEQALNAAGCGPSQVSFDVAVDKTLHPLSQPEAAKSLVYVINPTFQTTKIGLDGSWAGANHAGSYFFFSAAAGDHRLCMSMQGDHKQGAATSFTAVVGRTYYFRASFRTSTGWELKEVDPAEGLFLIASAGLSNYHLKK